MGQHLRSAPSGSIPEFWGRVVGSADARAVVNAAATRSRVRDDIVRLVHRGLPVPEFSRAVGEALSRAVPAEGTCLMTVDPATLLPTAEFVENGLPAPELLRLVEIEIREQDFNKWVHLVHGDGPAASLSEVTAGDLDRSLRQREIRRPGGFSDELRVVLAGASGTWGQLTVFREANRPYFSSAEVRVRVVGGRPGRRRPPSRPAARRRGRRWRRGRPAGARRRGRRPAGQPRRGPLARRPGCRRPGGCPAARRGGRGRPSDPRGLCRADGSPAGHAPGRAPGPASGWSSGDR